MSKHHHQSREEQTSNRVKETMRLHDQEGPYQRNRMPATEDVDLRVTPDDSSIRFRAYQIHNEKGGNELDNWLEAERLLKVRDPAITGFMSEGNPNTQK